MLLLSLSEGAGGGVVEVVSPTKAEGLEVSGSRRESDFSCFYQDFNLCGLWLPICFHWEIISLPALPLLFPAVQPLEHTGNTCLNFNQPAVFICKSTHLE